MAIIGRNGKGEIVFAANVCGPMATTLINEWLAKNRPRSAEPKNDHQNQEAAPRAE